ncbi:MAG: hypothetical protein ACFFD2_12465 [Promethearchaeota archaeon]
MDKDIYELIITSLTSGKYSYLAIARDFANNINILFDENFHFEIIQDEKNYTNYIFILLFISFVGLIWISIFIIYKKYQIYIAQKREWN